MKPFVHLIFAIGCLALIAACGDDLDTTTSNGEDITGGWFLACFVDGSDGAEITRTYSGDGFAWIVDGWQEDTACSGSSSFTMTGSTNVTFIGTKTVSNLTVSTYDWIDNASTVTPNSATAASVFNAAGAWEITDWASGVSQNVLGTGESGAEEDTRGKGILRVDTVSSPSTLQFEDESAATDSSGYPEALDTTRTYTKQ